MQLFHTMHHILKVFEISLESFKDIGYLFNVNLSLIPRKCNTFLEYINYFNVTTQIGVTINRKQLHVIYMMFFNVISP